jgi:hypothetical protein
MKNNAKEQAEIERKGERKKQKKFISFLYYQSVSQTREGSKSPSLFLVCVWVQLDRSFRPILQVTQVLDFLVPLLYVRMCTFQLATMFSFVVGWPRVYTHNKNRR